MWALELLAEEDRSEEELRCALRTRGVDAEVAEAVCEEFRVFNYLNDARVAELQARRLVGEGWGSQQIRRKLTERGLGLEDVEAALVRLEEEEPGVWGRLARSWVKAWFGRRAEELERSQRARAFRGLRYRGFEASVAGEVAWSGGGWGLSVRAGGARPSE